MRMRQQMMMMMMMCLFVVTFTVADEERFRQSSRVVGEIPNPTRQLRTSLRTSQFHTHQYASNRDSISLS